MGLFFPCIYLRSFADLAMSSSVMWWSLLAVAIFWMVGAYNRLVRMRARCFENFMQVNRHLLKYASLINEHTVRWTKVSNCDAVDVGMDAPLQWPSLLVEVAALERLIQDAVDAPWGDKYISAVNAAGNSITTTWGRLRNVPADLAGDAVPDALLREWDENSMNVKVSIDRFNENVAEYNAAVTQFPANIIGSFFRLKIIRQFSMFNEA